MSEYELEDLLTSTTLAGVEVFGLYLTVLASYLVAAYLAGRQLTKLQATTISVLFVFGAFLSAYTNFAYMARAIPIADSLELLHPERFYGAQPFAQRALFILEMLGIIACLKFMWDVRHPKEE